MWLLLFVLSWCLSSNNMRTGSVWMDRVDFAVVGEAGRRSEDPDLMARWAGAASGNLGGR